jgi:hypothetical protein
MSYKVTVKNPSGFTSESVINNTAELVKWAMQMGQSFDRNQNTFHGMPDGIVMVKPRFGTATTIIEVIDQS